MTPGDVELWGCARTVFLPADWTLTIGETEYSGSVTTLEEARYIAVTHPLRQYGEFSYTLRVVDAMGIADSSSSVFQVVDPTEIYEAYPARGEGLRYLYQQQNISTIQAFHGGWYSWRTASEAVGATGAALLAMLRNGHHPDHDPKEDIYAECMKLGFDWLARQMGSVSLAEEYDYNANGRGVYYLNDGAANALAVMALASCATPQTILRTGPLGGVTHQEVLQDCVDLMSYCQADSGDELGGWRWQMTLPDVGADNIATPWYTRAIDLCKQHAGCHVPESLIENLADWLQWSQHEDGGFGYRAPYDRRSIATTAGGWCATALVSDLYDRSDEAMDWIGAHWVSPNGHDDSWPSLFDGNSYEMLMVSEAARSQARVPAQVGWRYWYEEFSLLLLFHDVWGQREDGHWDGCAPLANTSPELSTAFALLILSDVTRMEVPVAMIAGPDTVALGEGFDLTGSRSYHMNWDRSIVAYEWDLDLSDGLDFSDSYDADVYHAGFSAPGVYRVALRVSDDGNPMLQDTDVHEVVVVDMNHSPIAVRNTPWCIEPGEDMYLDGGLSWDPDGDPIIAYEWDLDGDLLFDDFFGVDTLLHFDEAATGLIGLRVYDVHGAVSENSSFSSYAVTRNAASAEAIWTANNSCLVRQTNQVLLSAFLRVNEGETLNGVQFEAWLGHWDYGGQRIALQIFSNVADSTLLTMERSFTAPNQAGQYTIYGRVILQDEECDTSDNVVMGLFHVYDDSG